MAFYRVKHGALISSRGIDYAAGQIVELDDAEASFHRNFIEFADLLWDSGTLHRNWSFGLTEKVRHRIPIFMRYSEIESISAAALGVITTKTDHCIKTGDAVALIDVETCPDADGNYTVASAPTLKTLTLTGYSTVDHGQPVGAKKSFIGEYSTDVGWPVVAQIWNPATTTQKITESCEIESQAGERRIWLVSPSQLPLVLIPGDRLTCQAAGVNNVTIEAVGSWAYEDRGYRMGVQLAIAATVTQINDDWVVSRTVPEDGLGSVIGSIATSWSGANLILDWPILPTGSYYYSIQKSVGTDLVGIMRGQVSYGLSSY